jgi:starch synthase
MQRVKNHFLIPVHKSMTNQKYSIVIVSAEFSPLAKTGGLGDMVAALAAGLRKKGHDVRVVLPLYGQILDTSIELRTALPSVCVAMGFGEIWCAVRYAETDENIPIYFIEHHVYFGRLGFYHDEQYHEYADNPDRFGFFCKASLQLIVDLDLRPNIIQVNDWHVALVPFYMKTMFPNHRVLGNCASVLTIHNASYQGTFADSHSARLCLPSRDAAPAIFEEDGRINFLKTGICYSDAVNTVSPTYAQEIKDAKDGPGLAPIILTKGDRFRGILNGVDYDSWSPEKDSRIPARYCAADMSGKLVCKTHLQRQFHLEENPRIALIGFIGRLAQQKGVDLLKAAIEYIADTMVVQFVVLGSGEPYFEHYFRSLPSRYPGKIGSYIGFRNEIAHIIEAGSDFLVMPSLFEPCGLNQMYSLRYGTLPIVRATGGLSDTIENYDEAGGTGTGFKFWDYTVDALYGAVGWAVRTYYDRPHHMRMLRERAMRQDFSWDRSVMEYERLFETAMEAKNKTPLLP